MKRLVLSLAAISLMCANTYSQILKNPGLEIWVQDTFQTTVQIQGFPVSLTSEYNKPEFWSSSNQFTNLEDDNNLISLNQNVARKDSSSFAGNYAAKLSVKTIDLPQGQIPVPGAISNGTLNLNLSQNAQDFSFSSILNNVTGGNAVQARPSNFSGYYKYIPAGDDSLFISVQARSWNSAKGESEVVGEGTFFSSDTQSTYNQFNVALSYSSCKMPDTVLVSLSAGASQQTTPGTEMYVDSLSIDTLDSQSNFPPFANDDDTSTRKNNSVTVDILDNDVDCDDPILQSTQQINQASNGSVTIQDSTATYTPNSGFSGTDQFSYSIADSNEEDTATVSVAVNSAPQAQNDTTFTVTNDSSVRVDVTTNDSDPEGHTIAVETIATSPSNGSANVVSDDTIAYTPNNGYTGADQLEYVVCDNASPVLCDTATVQYDVVTRINDHQNNNNTQVNVFPNPAQKHLYIQFNDGKQFQNDYQLRMINTTGKIVKDTRIQDGQSKVNVKNMPQGLYLFEIYTSSGKILQRGKFNIAD